VLTFNFFLTFSQSVWSYRCQKIRSYQRYRLQARGLNVSTRSISYGNSTQEKGGQIGWSGEELGIEISGNLKSLLFILKFSLSSSFFPVLSSIISFAQNVKFSFHLENQANLFLNLESYPLTFLLSAHFSGDEKICSSMNLRPFVFSKTQNYLYSQLNPQRTTQKSNIFSLHFLFLLYANTPSQFSVCYLKTEQR